VVALITDDSWIEFIRTFFGIKAPQEWIRHVASNWNHLKAEPGCDCKFEWWRGEQEYCDGYLELESAKKVSFSEVPEDDDEPYTWDSFKSS